MHKFAAVVHYSAAVAAHKAVADPCARTELPPTALVRMLSFVHRLMAPLRSEKKFSDSPSWRSGRRFRRTAISLGF
jgi:hypothetical protein